MSTVIYPSPIFGPVRSRRLGVSLGINLMPADGKVCSFDCIYCECGLNGERRPTLPRPSRKEVAEALERKLKAMAEEGVVPDVLTFAGNGEPTAHPSFPEIISDTIALRDRLCPNAKISVLSNATFIGREKIREALMKIENNIQKLDTVNADYIRRVNRPLSPRYNPVTVVENLRKFNGHVIIQTMFLHGADADNTDERFVAPWIEALKLIKPQSVMIYTVDRETPVKGLTKASREELDAIRDRVIAEGIPCTASY